MKIKSLLAILWIVTLLVAMAWVGKEGYRAAVAYEQSAYELSRMLQAEEVAQSRLSDLASVLTLGLVKNEHRQKVARALQEKERLRTLARRWAIWFAVLTALVLLSGLLLPLRHYTALLSLAALIALINGLITPILMVEVHKEVEYLGDVVLSFESKGILGSVSKLIEQGNLPVATVIVIFSIALPVLKTLSLLFVSLFEYRPFAARVVRLFKHLGRWSMLDVFVVALLVVYLGSGNSDVSRSEIEIGIYFFALYVFLSMAASLAADRMLDRVKS